MAVYEKSLIGWEELQSSQRVLNLRQRQVLILVDGKRSTGDLEKALQHAQVGEIIAELEQLGFISPIGATRVQPKSVTNATPPEKNPDSLALSPRQIEAIQLLLIESTDQYLGVMGKALRDKIAHAENDSQIRACISQWHMALLESKSGRGNAHQLLQEVRELQSAEDHHYVLPA